MRDGEQRFDTAAVLTRPELLAALSQALLGQLASGRPISAGRRELQQLYVEQLATFTLESPAEAAEDLRALARWHLTQTAQVLTDPRDEPRTDEPYTRAQLSELKVRISKVLAAQLADSR